MNVSKVVVLKFLHRKCRTDKDRLHFDGNPHHISTICGNEAGTDKYEPGSAFKLLTVAAAYEHAVDANSTLLFQRCAEKAIETTIKCHKIAGHGQQTLTEALKNSCNVAMNIAFQLGVRISFISISMPLVCWTVLELICRRTRYSFIGYA